MEVGKSGSWKLSLCCSRLPLLTVQLTVASCESSQESPNTPGLAGPDTATLHYQGRMSLCLIQIRVNKYSEEAELCSQMEEEQVMLSPQGKGLTPLWFLQRRNGSLEIKIIALGIGRKEDGTGRSREGVQRTLFMMILSRMSCKTSATLQLGKVFKPAAVVLQLRGVSAMESIP